MEPKREENRRNIKTQETICNKPITEPIIPCDLAFVSIDMTPKTTAGTERKSKGHPKKPISSQGNKDNNERINDKFP